mgnify:CR=1
MARLLSHWADALLRALVALADAAWAPFCIESTRAGGTAIPNAGTRRPRGD